MALIAARYPRHGWPGNARELRACVENVASHHDYTPPSGRAPARLAAPAMAANDLVPGDAGADLGRALLRGELSLDELRRRYIPHALAQKGSYTAAAALLGIDRRVVREVALAAGVSEPRPRRRR